MDREVTLLDYERNKAFIKSKEEVYQFIKRTFDIIMGILGCAILFPMMIIVKICYVLSGDFDQIIFVQRRIGKDGKEFDFYKFRSMIKNADEVLFQMLEENEDLRKEYEINKKLKNDPRITKIGKFLRKTSLDELPQMVNVLAGEMSLIGNRPYLPREKKDMGKYYSDIIKTKPGLSGLWQVSGRSKTTFKKRLKIESYYSNNCGLKMDIKIFFKTFKVVLKMCGAK